MTYKSVLSDFFEIISLHKMIKTAGYGPLSEIKVPHGTYDTDYPYVFLNPTNHTLGNKSMTYRFNMIIMEMCDGDIDAVIQAQSNCLEYAKDILGHFYYHLEAYDFTLNSSVIPFKEKYDDVVSGVTVAVDLTVRDALNDCIAPFTPEYEEIIWVYNNADNLVDGDVGQNHVYTFAGNYFNPNGDWQTNKFVVPESGIYKLVLDMAITLVQPLPGEAMPPVPVVLQQTEGPDPYLPADVMTGWPTVFVNDTQVYNIHGEWIIDATLTPGGYTWEFIFSQNIPGEQSGVVQKAGSELKIYKAY